nr:unnamed protein product [Digitaria exilis]
MPYTTAQPLLDVPGVRPPGCRRCRRLSSRPSSWLRGRSSALRGPDGASRSKHTVPRALRLVGTWLSGGPYACRAAPHGACRCGQVEPDPDGYARAVVNRRWSRAVH